MKESTKTLPRSKQLYRVRVEGFDSSGNNLGFIMHEKQLPNLEAAIDEARDMYKKNFFKQAKQVTIKDEESEILWSYKSWQG